MFAKQNTCGSAADDSPDLSWSGAPAAKSFAVVFTDQTNNLIHWAIWDIPANASGLPTAVQKAANPANVPGAQQVTSYDGATFGYLGPCPPVTHTYQFVVYALDVATLPGLSTSSKRSEVEATAKAHSLDSATLSGQAGKQN
jgi:hypothetical protein